MSRSLTQESVVVCNPEIYSFIYFVEEQVITIMENWIIERLKQQDLECLKRLY